MELESARPLRSVSQGAIGMQEAMVASGQEPLGISLAISKKALSSKINSAPADYILVDGQSFRVSRSPRSEGLSPRAAQQAGQPGHEDRSKELQAGAALLAGAGKTAHITRQEDDTSWLRRQLAEANAFIEKQRKELQGRDDAIAELEGQLQLARASVSSVASSVSGSGPRRSASEGDGEEVTRERSASSSAFAGRFREQVVSSGPTLPPTPDRTEDMHTGNQNSAHSAHNQQPSPTASLSLQTVHTIETADSGPHVPRSASSQLESNTSSPSIFITPTSADSLDSGARANPYPFNEPSSKLGSKHFSPEDERKLRACTPPFGSGAGIASSLNADGTPSPPSRHQVPMGAGGQGQKDVILIGSDPLNTVTPTLGRPPKGLAARLAMSSVERRRVSEDRGTHKASTPTNRGSLGLKAKAIVPKLEPKYMSAMASLTPRTAAKTSHLFLFHDNPQLGSSVASKLEAREGCEMMLEAKAESSGLTRFMVGRIIYSGSLQTMPGVPAAALANPRGSQCIQVLCAFGVQCDLKKLSTRAKGEIMEVDLRGVNAESFDVTSPEEIKAFLEPCKSRVDVILDPMRDGFWFPYWEARRRMAPQFRSRGVGYIRLGDDMSRNGTAFLSTDVGENFLDDGAYDDDGSNTESFNGRSTFPGGSNRRAFSAGAADPGTLGKTIGAETMEIATTPIMSASECDVELRNILGQLDDNQPGDDIKWADRQALLRRLYDLFAESADTSAFPIKETINVLVQTITRQKNPHVLRSAIACVRVVGDNISVLTVNAMVWRLLVVETINLLKSAFKPVIEETRRTLNYLHSKCVLKLVSMANGGLLEEIFGSNRAPSRGGLSTPTGSRSSPRESGRSTPTHGPPTPTNSNSKCGGIISWLVEVVHRELAMALSDAARFRASQEDLQEPVSLYERADVGGLACRCVHLLAHREESTRAAGSDFVAGLLAMDVFQTLAPGEGFAQVALIFKHALKGGTGRLGSGRRSPSSSPLTTDGSVLESKSSATLNEMLSDSGKQSLIEIYRCAPRALEKTALAACTLVISMSDGNGKTDVNLSAATTATNARPISGSSVPNRGERAVRRTSHLRAPSPIKDMGSGSSEAIFFEAKLVLQSVPRSQEDWDVMNDTIRAAPAFFQSLASTSKQMAIARGALIRQVLPFDESTSSNDQASTGFDSGLAELVTSGEKHGVSTQVMVDLRARALEIRKLIRVKMADEADLDQAIQAVAIVEKFCDMITERSHLEGVPPIEIVGLLR